ncbi:MAG: HlyD family efflux transporter periplasmic adaptor subunit [Pseudomonadota bacterium]
MSENNDTPQNQPPYPELQQNSEHMEIQPDQRPPMTPETETQQPKKPSAWKANVQLLIVLGFIIGGFIISQNLQVEEETQKQETEIRDLLVETVTITPTNKKIAFTRTGNVSVNGQINIVPQVSGRITKVNEDFNDGGIFKENQTLFHIEQADFINAVNIAKSQVEQARTALKIQQAESEASIAEWNSINPDLPSPPLVAKAPQLQQAQASLTAARAQLADANLALKRTKFSYDFPGRIIDTTVKNGQFVQAGQSYGQAYPKDALEVIVPVEDKILKYMGTEDNEVIIRTKYRGKEIALAGQIDRIGSVLNQNTRFVDVIIKPKEDNWDILVPGVFVEVDLIGKSIENVWSLPNETLQGQDFIWTVQDKKLQKQTLQVITTSDNLTDAIGNTQTVDVVVGLLKGANDGMSVRISEVNKNEETGGAPPKINPPITTAVDKDGQEIKE